MSEAVPNPIDDADLFDAIELGGVRSPGQIKSMTGHDRKINWDVKEGQGQSGASSTLKSIPLRVLSITFFLSDTEDFEAWADFSVLIYSTIAGPKPKALDIYHPDLAMVDIRSVTLANFGGVVHDGKGGQTITVQFQEYAPPKPKGGSATGSTTKKKAPDPNAAANAELAALTEQYKKTPWGKL